MAMTVHDYTVLLERVMCFGVTVESLTKQVKVEAKGSQKATSRHVPSGSYRIALDPSGVIPVERVGGQVTERRDELDRKMQKALAPIREALAIELKKHLEQAKTVDEMRHALALSSVLRDIGGLRILMAMPSDGDGTLALAGAVVLDPPVAEALKPQLVAAIESVLQPERDQAVTMVRKLALAALGKP